ncbi:hypothetical protein R3P38DRAFT_3203698 [Favolaschia claudopus]|uniref:XPG-I domain-containing protein n=1 Tax=Favolaschia claudopus TaxID=2862362 RepID=A0AAW0AU11_9AGAR
MDEIWPLLDRALQCRPLKNLAIDEGFVVNRNGIQSLRIGIDAVSWLSEPNITLQDICCRLCRLLGLCVTAVFLFDKTATQDPLAPPFNALIEAFGFYSCLVKGDVVTDLACLNRMGSLDLIFTTEMEALVLGATHVVYSPQEDDFIEAFVYTSHHIQARTCLSQGGLLLFVLLMGGKYSEGLPGCTEAIALRQALRGLGDTLLLAAQTLSSAELNAFLAVWRADLRVGIIVANTMSEMVADVSDSFPDIVTRRRYARPSPTFVASQTTLWVPRAPDFAALRKLWRCFFQWRSVASIPQGFLSAFISAPQNELQVLQAHLLHNTVAETIPPLSSFLSIRGHSRTAFKVDVFIAPIIAAICEGAGPPSAKMCVTVPRQILARTLPSLVQHYEKCTPIRVNAQTTHSQPILGSTAGPQIDPHLHRDARSRRFGGSVYSGALIYALKAHHASHPLEVGGVDEYLRLVIAGIIQEGKEEEKENIESVA